MFVVDMLRTVRVVLDKYLDQRIADFISTCRESANTGTGR
jgi:hypothetical protein